jgi:pimeloyl-ACP methyl ester carboxylesterase
MPITKHRGQDIAYTVDGDGPLVILQHGLLGSAASWVQLKYVDALKDRFRVACVDSLGHGLSAKPSDPSLYKRKQRAGDIIAVMDALGAKKAHLVGYSMGGWISTGVAQHYPERLASLTVGGWDVQGGVATAMAGAPSSFDQVIENTRKNAPALVAWVTPEAMPGLRACWTELSDLEGAGDALKNVPCPVMLWNGREDPPHDPMRAFAKANDFEFLSTPGDHLGARFQHAAEAVKGIRAFLENVESTK